MCVCVCVCVFVCGMYSFYVNYTHSSTGYKLNSSCSVTTMIIVILRAPTKYISSRSVINFVV